MNSDQEQEEEAHRNRDANVENRSDKDNTTDLADALVWGLESTVESIDQAELSKTRSKYAAHFEHAEYTITPDPNICVPSDNSLWFALFSHFAGKCERWQAVRPVGDQESFDLLRPFADSRDEDALNATELHGFVNDDFVHAVEQNAVGRHGQIRWFRFVISSEARGFHLATEHFGLEFTVQSNDAADVDYLRKAVPDSMHLQIWTQF